MQISATTRMRVVTGYNELITGPWIVLLITVSNWVPHLIHELAVVNEAEASLSYIFECFFCMRGYPTLYTLF